MGHTSSYFILWTELTFSSLYVSVIWSKRNFRRIIQEQYGIWYYNGYQWNTWYYSGAALIVVCCSTLPTVHCKVHCSLLQYIRCEQPNPWQGAGPWRIANNWSPDKCTVCTVHWHFPWNPGLPQVLELLLAPSFLMELPLFLEHSHSGQYISNATFYQNSKLSSSICHFSFLLLMVLIRAGMIRTMGSPLGWYQSMNIWLGYWKGPRWPITVLILMRCVKHKKLKDWTKRCSHVFGSLLSFDWTDYFDQYKTLICIL